MTNRFSFTGYMLGFAVGFVYVCYKFGSTPSGLVGIFDASISLMPPTLPPAAADAQQTPPAGTAMEAPKQSTAPVVAHGVENVNPNVAVLSAETEAAAAAEAAEVERVGARIEEVVPEAREVLTVATTASPGHAAHFNDSKAKESRPKPPAAVAAVAHAPQAVGRPLHQEAAISTGGEHHTFRNSPTVYIGIMPARSDQDFELAALKRSAWRVKERKDARFDFKCCLRKDNIEEFEKLPPRPWVRPYLIWSHGRIEGLACLPTMQDPKNVEACKKLEQLMLRKDFLFINFDLRDPWLLNDTRTPLPGVTMAPPKYYSGPQFDLRGPPAFFMTFRGQLNDGYWNSAHVRSDLKRSFEGLGRQDVVVESLPRNKTYRYTSKDKARYAALLNTAYALVPHGDGRWNYRFSEVVGACAIPVVIADGVSWPYSEIIDWSEAAVWISEDFKTVLNTSRPLQRERRLGSNPKLNPLDLLGHLPTQPEVIQRMRRRVCEINEHYFKTPDKRWAALLRSAAIRVRASHH